METVENKRAYLEDLREGLVTTDKELQEINSELNILLEIPEVKQYIDLEYTKKGIVEKRNKLNGDYTRLNQSLCNHPLWYLLSHDYDEYEGRMYWKCKCLNCGFEYEGRPHDFNTDTIIRSRGIFGRSTSSEHSYHEITKAYARYSTLYNSYKENKGQELNESIVPKLMTKKFTSD